MLYKCGNVSLPLSHPILCVDDNAGGAVVIGLYHLSFVERQEDSLTFFPANTIAFKFCGL